MFKVELVQWVEGYGLWVTGYRSLVTDYWLRVSGHGSRVIDFKFTAEGLEFRLR